MTQTLMNAETRYALATRAAAALGRTLAVPFPSDTYLSVGFDAAFVAHPAPATFTFNASGQCIALIDPADRAALDALIGAVA